MSQNIEGKVVVITGASSGLGESTARHLAKLGATVVLGARRKDRLAMIVVPLPPPATIEPRGMIHCADVVKVETRY
jgi:NADP-dependent 3-hydroxy acid dehydrogenase YdfG